MSTTLIAGLVVTGIALLIVISYISQIVENNKLEKARIRADLHDRIQRSRHLSESLPEQLIKPSLKLLLCRIEAHYCKRLQNIDKQDHSLSTRVNELHRLLALGENIPISNQHQLINSEAKAREVRMALENLQALINRAEQDDLLNAAESKRWGSEIRHMLIRLHIEFFNTIGQQMLQKGRAGHARLAYERGVQYLRKQPEVIHFKTQLEEMKLQLAKADALVLERSSISTQETSELNDGLKNLDDDWKKKNFYD